MNLQYNDIEQHMKLINSDNYSFLFLCENDKNINSEDILHELIQNEELEKDYCKKQIKRKELTTQLSRFTASICTYKFKEKPNYNKELGYYIVEDGEKYFSNTYNNKLTNMSDLNISMFINQTQLFF